MSTSPNRHILISGGTKGLGRALSLCFARHGFGVTAVYREDQKSADELENIFREQQLTGSCIKFDITTQASMELSLGPIHELIVVNNACCHFTPKPFHLVTKGEVENLCSTVVWGSFNFLRSSLKILVAAQKATVINVLSSSMNIPVSKGFSHYIAAKMGLVGLSQSLESEFKHRGINVMNTYPDYMETSLTKEWSPLFKEAVVGTNRVKTPDETASEIYDQYVLSQSGLT